ncbi:MAG: hypothetical protein K5651_02000, partial [Bacteroidales bacterium]|nr:hypothetical protein [Bacteroidales bacterium]
TIGDRLVGVADNTNSSTTFSSALYNAGTVSNSASASGGSARICVGGLVGKAQGLAMTNCHNNGSVSNSGVGSDATAGVRMGGLVGFATETNALAGTSSSSCNYNNGAVTEASTSSIIAVGGVVGYADNASTDLAYCQNRSDGDIMLGKDAADCTHGIVYVGGVLACASASTSFDYASNAGDIVFNRLDISGQVFAGGVHGAFTDFSGSQTITGCHNSGEIKTKSTSKPSEDLKSTDISTQWSYFGGISGVGEASSQKLYAFGTSGKTFTSCVNEGPITLHTALRTCAGGVLAWSENCPTGCVCSGDIRLRKRGGADSGTSDAGSCDYYRGLCGGIIGYCSSATLYNLKFKAGLNTNDSSPYLYTGGIVGMTNQDTTFDTCKVGKGIFQATGSGTTAGNVGLFCNHIGQNTYTFTSCTIETGTKYYISSEVTVTDANLSNKMCLGGVDECSVSGSLPSVGSID